MRWSNDVLPPAKVLEPAMGLAAALAAKPPLALQWIKLTCNRALRARPDLVLDYGIALEMMSMNTAGRRAVVAARLEQRAQCFESRKPLIPRVPTGSCRAR